MSVYGSVKTNFSVSEMSLASSALMTAQSSYTFSDGDYETSSELLSPRTVTNENFEISRCSSSVHCSADASYSAVCPLNSSTLDDGEESFMSYEASKYGFTVKSDSCLSQQEKAITKFMDDVLRVQVEQVAEPNLLTTEEDSIDPVGSKSFPIINSLESPVCEIDINIGDSLNPKNEEYNDINFGKCMNEKREQTFSIEENTFTENQINESTFYETKNKIMENLSQVTCDKLFSKSGLRHLNSINYCPSIIKTKEKTTSQVEPVEPIIRKSVTSQKSQFSRRSLRSIGVESLLRIDHELQPLNLMLSKLLAEFRAMIYRERLNFDESSSFCSTSCFRLVDKNHFQRFSSRETSLERCAKSFVTDEAKSVNKETENACSIKKEKDTFVNFLRCEQCTRATSVSHDLLSEDQATSDTKSSPRTPRSCQSSSVDSPDSRRGKPQSRVKTLRKRRSHSHKKSTARCARQSSREANNSVTGTPEQEETSRGGGDDVAILDKIEPAPPSCIVEQLRADSGDGRAKNPDVDEAPGKKNENESSTLLHLRSEKTEASDGFGVSCRQLISLGEHHAYLAQLRQLREAMAGEGAGDSISAANEEPLKRMRDFQRAQNDGATGETMSAGGDVGDDSTDDCAPANFQT